MLSLVIAAKPSSIPYLSALLPSELELQSLEETDSSEQDDQTDSENNTNIIISVRNLLKCLSFLSKLCCVCSDDVLIFSTPDIEFISLPDIITVLCITVKMSVIVKCWPYSVWKSTVVTCNVFVCFP